MWQMCYRFFVENYGEARRIELAALPALDYRPHDIDGFTRRATWA